MLVILLIKFIWTFPVNFIFNLPFEISDCPLLEKRVFEPTNVKDLRADDISVFLSMGDSATAGFGAKAEWPITTKWLNEDRGVSFSSGGDVGIRSVSNFFKHFQPNLIGQSFESRRFTYCGSGDCGKEKNFPEIDGLNGAISAATWQVLPLELEYLLTQLNQLDKETFNQKWKLLNIFIGANNICQTCQVNYDIESYEMHLTDILMQLKAQVPRLVVNIVLIPKLSHFNEMPSISTKCQLRSLFLKRMCPCAFTEQGRISMDILVDKMNESIFKIKQKIEPTDSTDTFGIILNPFLTNFNEINDKFVSNVDCFHPSAFAHSQFATTLWNNLFLPFKARKTWLELEQEQIFCPKESDRLIID